MHRLGSRILLLSAMQIRQTPSDDGKNQIINWLVKSGNSSSSTSWHDQLVESISSVVAFALLSQVLLPAHAGKCCVCIHIQLYIYTHMHQPLYRYISITTSHWSTFSFNGSRAKTWQIYQMIQMFNPIQQNSSYGTHWIIFPRPQLTRHNPRSQLRTKMPRRRRLNFHEEPAISPKTNYLKQGNENPESPGFGDRSKRGTIG